MGLVGGDGRDGRKTRCHDSACAGNGGAGRRDRLAGVLAARAGILEGKAT